MSAKERLIGNDGAIYLKSLAVEIVGGLLGTETLDELVGGTAGDGGGKGFYQVTTIGDTATYFAWDNPEIKDYFYNDGTGVLEAGDTAIPVVLLETDGEDTSIKSFDISLTKDKIDVTTIADRKQKTYRMGKVDASGTMSGITLIGNDLIKNRFLDIMTVSATGTFTMSRKTDDELYFVGYLNDEEISGDTLVAVVGKIEIESGSMGATDGSAQEFSSGFAPSSGDRLQVININIA